MRSELHSALGLYSPSFFKMHIDVREPLINVFNLSSETSAAFLHEYVHFLQDITTIYGQKNIISVVDYIKTVNYNQLLHREENYIIPYIPNEGRDGGAYFNNELQKLHIGTLSMNYSGPIVGIEIEVVSQNVGYAIKEIETINLTLPGGAARYKFGSHSIIESMAFGIEQCVYPEAIEQPNDFCYTASSEVVRFCYPVLLADAKNVIALCDATLMYYNPAAVFYRALEKMAEENFIPETPYDIYAFIYSNFEVQFHTLTDISQIFNNHSLTAISQLEGYFTTELFSSNRVWMRDTLTSANLIRNTHWGFFVDLASQGPLNQNRMFAYLFAQLGMPMTTNQDSIAVFATPSNNSIEVRPEILWAINQIYNIYINSPKSAIRRCGMVEYCQESCRNQNVEDYTNDHCYDDPWSRAKDNNLCSFAQIWKSWGMEDIFPTLNR